MPYAIFRRIAALPVPVHLAATAATFVGFNWIKARLDQSYAASNHPVDYATGQTTFDGDAIKGFYAHMSDLGTLDVYRTTQLIDFGFITMIACMGLFFATLIARAARDGSWGRWFGLTAGLCAVFGAVCDAIENGWSFVMLADPAGFANWLALPYSGFASLKFAFITAAMGCLLLSLLCAATGRLSRRAAIG